MPKHIAIKVLCLTTIFLVALEASVIGQSKTEETVARQLLDSGRADRSGDVADAGARSLSLGKSSVFAGDMASKLKISLSGPRISFTGSGANTFMSVKTEKQIITTKSMPIREGFSTVNSLTGSGISEVAQTKKVTKTKSMITETNTKAFFASQADSENQLIKSASFQTGSSFLELSKSKVTKSSELQFSSMRKSLSKVPLTPQAVQEFLTSSKVTQSVQKENTVEQIEEFMKENDSIPQIQELTFQSRTNMLADEQTQTFQSDVETIDSIFEICDRSTINAAVEKKRGLDGVEPTWVDRYFALYFMEDPSIDLKNAHIQLIARRDNHVELITKYQTLLNDYADKRMHIYGTTYLNVRVRYMINIIRKFFVFDAITEPTAPKGFELWFQNLKTDTLTIENIQNMSEICERDFALTKALITGQLPEGTTADAKAVWEGYVDVMTGLKLELCLLAESLVLLYGGAESMMSKRSTLLVDNKEGVERLNQGVYIEFAETYFNNFRYLLDPPMRPAQCATGGAKTLQETIQFARIGKIITGEVAFKEENSYFSELFFSYILKTPTGSYGKFIEADMILVRREWTISPLNTLEELGGFRLAFHAEFFNIFLSHEFKIFQGEGAQKTVVTIKLKNEDLYKILFYNEEQRNLAEDSGDITFYLSNVIVYLYKLYVLVRVNPEMKITSETSMKEVYTMMYRLLFTEFETYGEFWQQAHFSRYYSTVLTFLCSKIDSTICVDSDEFNQQWEKVAIDPSDDPTPPKIKGKVWIIEILITIIKKYKRKKELDTFVIDWNKLGWNVNCDKKERKNIYEHKSLQKKINPQGQLVVQEDLTQYWLYNDGCTEELFKSVKTLITTFLTTTWKTQPFMDWWIVFLGVFETKEPMRIELIRYILIRIIRSYIREKTDIRAEAHIFTFIITLLHYYEKKMVSRLNLMETAGLYGLFDTLMNGLQLSAKRYQDYFDVEQFDNNMLRFDFYYLTQMAYLQTPISHLDETKKKLWDTNTQYMNFYKAKFFNYFNRKGESETLDSFNLKVLNCRKHKFYTVIGQETVQAAQQECASLDDNGKPLIVGDPRYSVCTMETNTYADCDAGFALEMLNYVLTAHVIIKSINIFDYFNYYHPYYLIGDQGEGNDQKHGTFTKDIRNKRFFLSSYKHLQVIRQNLEGQIDDVPEYALNKIMECINLDKLYTKDQVLKESLCQFSPSLYANMFWVFRHNYMVNFGGKSFNLDSWSPELTPMGTVNFFLLLHNSKAMEDDLDGLCDENEEVGSLPDLCKIKYLIDYWMAEIADGMDVPDQYDGTQKIKEIFLTKTNGQLKVNAVTQLTITDQTNIMKRDKFVILEAYMVMFFFMKKNLNALTRIRASLDYYNNNLNKQDTNIPISFFASIKAFEWSGPDNADEIQMMARIVRVAMCKFTVNRHEENLRQGVYALLQAGPREVTVSGQKVSRSLIEDTATMNGQICSDTLWVFMRFANTHEQYVKICQLLGKNNAFLDVMSFENRKDTLVRYIGGMNDCPNDQLAICLLEIQKQIMLENYVETSFESLRLGGDEDQENDLGDSSGSSQYIENMIVEQRKSQINTDIKESMNAKGVLNGLAKSGQTEIGNLMFTEYSVSSFEIQDKTSIEALLQISVEEKVVVQEEETVQVQAKKVVGRRKVTPKSAKNDNTSKGNAMDQVLPTEFGVSDSDTLRTTETAEKGGFANPNIKQTLGSEKAMRVVFSGQSQMKNSYFMSAGENMESMNEVEQNVNENEKLGKLSASQLEMRKSAAYAEGWENYKGTDLTGSGNPGLDNMVKKGLLASKSGNGSKKGAGLSVDYRAVLRQNRLRA